MRRVVAEGYPPESILYFNFEDERLKPYDPGLPAEVLDTFYAMNPRARREGAFLFFDEIQEVPEWGRVPAPGRRHAAGDRVRDGLVLQDAVGRPRLRVPGARHLARAVPHELLGVLPLARRLRALLIPSTYFSPSAQTNRRRSR